MNLKRIFKQKILDSVKNNSDGWHEHGYYENNLRYSFCFLAKQPFPWFFIVEKDGIKLFLYYIPVISKLFWAKMKILSILRERKKVNKYKTFINSLPEAERVRYFRKCKLERILKK